MAGGGTFRSRPPAAAAATLNGRAVVSLVLLVVALSAERRSLQRVLCSRHPMRIGGRVAVRGGLAHHDVLLLQGGIGRERARRAVAAAAKEFDLRGIWSLGFVGGLHDALRPGALVCPAVVLDDVDPADGRVEADPSHGPVSAALRGVGLAVEVGPLISVGDPLRTAEAKRAVNRRTGAVAVDMEAAGVARAACDLGIPWIALKAVVDAVEDPLPAFLAACATPDGNVCWGGLWTGLREGRAFWRSLRRIGGASRVAGARLRRGLDAAFGAWAALTRV